LIEMSHILKRTTASLCLATAALFMSATAAGARPWQEPELGSALAIRTVTVTEQRLTPDELALGALVGIALSSAGLVTVKVVRRREFHLFAFHI
jgi:hypothetical protein